MTATDAVLPLQIDGPTLDRIRQSNQDLMILDVREPWEVAICAIAGSVNVPLSTFPQNLTRLR